MRGQSEFSCNKCEREFKTQDALDMHNRDKHRIKIPRKQDNDRLTEADYQTWMRL